MCHQAVSLHISSGSRCLTIAGATLPVFSLLFGKIINVRLDLPPPPLFPLPLLFLLTPFCIVDASWGRSDSALTFSFKMHLYLPLTNSIRQVLLRSSGDLIIFMIRS